jgi:putative toxin-antitoxin system antitoxin component (TIGR02293 family)
MHKEPAAPPAACDEADWAARISYVTARSRQAFAGRAGYSGEWLCTPSPALEGQTPLEALASDPGFEAVKELLTKIEQGIYT